MTEISVSSRPLNAAAQIAPSSPITDREPKCWRCGRTLGAFFSRPWSLRCQRCKAENASSPEASA